MPDTTQRLCTNHNCQIRSYLEYILYGFLYTEGANSWGQVLVCCMLTQLIGHASRLLYYLISLEYQRIQLRLFWMLRSLPPW